MLQMLEVHTTQALVLRRVKLVLRLVTLVLRRVKLVLRLVTLVLRPVTLVLRLVTLEKLLLVTLVLRLVTLEKLLLVTLVQLLPRARVEVIILYISDKVPGETRGLFNCCLF